MKAWDNFIHLQEVELGKETVKKWLRCLSVLRFDAGNIFLEAKDSFQALWFEEHIRAKAEASLVNSNNRKIKVHLSVAGDQKPKEKGVKKKKNSEVDSNHSFDLRFDALDPLCTLENFVPSEKNKLIYKVLCELVGSVTGQTIPLATFNPIYLYGSTGTGKTHLMMSLYHCLVQKGLKVLYARAETFTDHVVGAFRTGQMSLFRQTYRNIDVLLLDDVHVFSRKTATQEELFHTFNTLHVEGKQIVLAANCAPNELHLIEPRLISRFEWGIVLPLEPLAKEELIRVLHQKSKLLGFPLSMKVTEFLVDNFPSNTKSLIKALEALILRLHADVKHPTAQLTVYLVKQVLADLLIEEEKMALTPQKIIQAVAEHYGIRPEDILGKAQSRDCALPRQMAMALCRSQLNMPYMKIGDAFDRDHSTVMTSVKQIHQALDTDSEEITSPWQSILKRMKNES